MSEKTVAQKLLIKEGYSVLFVNPPANLTTLLGGMPAGVNAAPAADVSMDLILAFIATRAELEATLPALKTRMKPGGLLWVAYHKGSSKTKTDINRDSIYAYGLTLGLTGVAIIAINEDWAALRMKKV
jgi:hypothetical protein